MSPAPVIAVVGPSGVGKDSLIRALAARDPRLRPVRRVITRPQGAQGEDCEVVGAAEFARRAAGGGFALCWQAHGLHYGIPAGIAQLRAGARGVLVNLSRAVLLDAQARFAPFVVLALSAPPEVLAARLAARGREDGADRAARLARAAAPLPEGLARVIRIDNGGPLRVTVEAALARLQDESL